jgi:undecaprenyl-diphosphatase|tara:strand:- start:207 stop:965 length:759 start_codon:yes stop_codon:yes gene_type:complete
MTFIEGIILGIIQGLTEFLPISSSGHLVLVQEILGLELPGNDFEILLHLGTLCSILVVFFKDIKNIFLTVSSKETQRFILMIIIGTLPALIIGLGLKDLIAELFDNLLVVGFALIFTGLTLISSFYFNRQKNEYSIFRSFLIGIAQAVAIIPGISRSGMTISCALLLGLDSKQAAKFSFLLAIPVIGGAGILMVTDIETASSIDFSTLMGGLFSSFFIGVVALKWLLAWLEDGKFHYFGIYCLLIGIITVIV